MLEILCSIHGMQKSKYTDGERSLGTLVTKTHDFLVFFLTKGPPYV